MKRSPLRMFLFATLVFQIIPSQAQWLGTNPESLSAAPQGVVVGTGGGASSALTIRGDQMATPTGEVFRTNAPGNTQTSWRLLNGGVEYGSLYHDPAGTDLWQAAPEGDMRWSTSSGYCMRLIGDQTNTIGAFPLVQTNDNLGIGRLSLTPNNVPWTKLHLIGNFYDAESEDGYRIWMAHGITFTRFHYQMYVGPAYRNSVPADAIFQWSDHPELEEGERGLVKFIYASDYTGAASGEHSEHGREILRMHPEGNVGLGDWNAATVAAGSPVEPTEHLDILDGRVRIRQLPTDPNADDPLNLTKYMVVDDDGVVHWRTLPPAAVANCEWTRLNAGVPGPKYVVSGYGTPSSTSTCPDRSWMYGIGVGTPSYKLQVVHNETEATSAGGIHVSYKGNDVGETRGVSALVEPAQSALSLGYGALYHVRGLGTTSSPFGSGMGSLSRVTLDLAGYTCGEVTGAMGDVYAKEGTASTVHGVRGYVISQLNGTVTTAYGVRASASASGAGTIATSYGVHGYGANGSTASYGVYGQAITGGSNGAFSIYGTSPGNGATDWSGYFAGRVQIQGDLWHGTTQIWSDAGLKTEVEELDNADERLAALTPRTYRYTSAAQERMVLPGGEQLGFVAQEVEQVLPELVSSTVIPAQLDSLGNEVYPELQIKGVNYVGLIPLLVAGYQEQRTTIADLQEQMADLQQALASCCSQEMGGGGDQRMQLHEGDAKSLLGDERALLIQPNPFSTATTVRYTLEKSGRMQLLANSSDGKELRVLQEGVMEPGQYSYEWHTAGLAPGVYYVTLLLDGEPLVKKAVKLER